MLSLSQQSQVAVYRFELKTMTGRESTMKSEPEKKIVFNQEAIEAPHESLCLSIESASSRVIKGVATM